MRTVSAQSRQLLEDLASPSGGGVQVQWVADLMYDGDRRLQNLGVADVDLSWDAGQFVVGSGSCRIVWADDHGSSMIPTQIGDWFSPFGAELQIHVLISAGPQFTERVPVGRFVIEEIPDAVESRLLHQGILVHPGESFTVRLRDRLMKVARDKFLAPRSPGSASAWREAQAITGLPVVRTVDDAVVPGSVTYDGDKSDALKKLFDLMGAWPRVDAAGALIGSPKAWPAPVDQIRGVVSAPVTMSAEKTYNSVIVQGKSPGGDAIYAARSVPDGFLRVANANGAVSPFGSKPYTYQSDFLTTQDAADAYAAELLPRVSRIRGVTREVVEPFNPLREVGDVLTASFGVVRVRRVHHTGGTTALTVEVGENADDN